MDDKTVAEIIKCRRDPAYFITNYCKIRHPIRGLINFKLWKFQEECINNFVSHSYNLILKARQLGLSTLLASYIAWLITFFSDKEVYVVATKGKTATNLIMKVKVVLENLPDWIKPIQTVDQRQNIELSNGSRAQATTTTNDAGRSEALSLLIIDECSFIRNMETLWVGAQPTLSTGGDCIVLSTPNGVGNWFHKQCKMAEEGEKIQVGEKITSFNFIKLPWTVHPERNQKWAVAMKKKIGEKAFSQEHEINFEQSGSNVVAIKDLDFYLIHPSEFEEPDPKFRPFIREPLEKTYSDKNLWRWQYPDYTKKYILSADVARGDGGDYSAFHIIDTENYEQVAEYKGKLNTDDYSRLIFNTAIEYNNAFIIIENASVGHAVVMKVLELGYQNMFWTIRDINNVNSTNVSQFRYDIYNLPKNAVPGFTTSSRTRPLMIEKMEEDLRNHEFILHSRRTYNELEVFIYDGGKPVAMSGYNDDLVMSLAIGLYVRATTMRIENIDSELSNALLQNMHRNTTQYFPNSLVKNDETGINHYEMVIRGKKENIGWLIT